MLLSTAGALASEAAFPNRSLWPLAPVGVALLLLALRGASVPRALGCGWLWGTVFFLVHLWWAREAAGAVPWLLLGVAEACFVALFAAAWVLARRWGPVERHPALGVVVLACLWVATETARGLVPFGGLPWGKLAFSQTTGPLLRLASLGGEALVSGAVVMVGALLALALVHLRHARIGRASGAVVVAAALAAVGLAVPVDTRAEAGTLRVGAVQGNVPGAGLDAFAVRRDVLERHVTGTEALLEEVEPGELDVVLWPENSTDLDPRVDAEAGRLVERAAAAVDAPILVGAQRYTETHRYNEAILWEPGHGEADVYAKQHPAPFAEYVPLRDVARRVTDAVDLVPTDMLPGEELGVIELDSPRLDRVVDLAVGICFEVAYAGLLRDAVLAGGEVLVVPTNNASFGYTQESAQQLGMSVFRAVEHGRATVQISTVGISGVIAPNGVVTHSTGLFTADRVATTLPLRTSLTVADRIGPWLAIVAGTLAGGALAAGTLAGRGRRRQKRRS